MTAEEEVEAPDRDRAGDAVVKASWTGTALFVATAGLAAAVPEADLPALVVALVLFVGGTVAFAAALLRAASRSRHEELTMGGLFFLEGSPKTVRRQLFGSLAIAVVVAFVTAGLRPNSSLAFGILAPVWGEGLAALWAARHGTFPPRLPPSGPGTARGGAVTRVSDPATGGAPDEKPAGPPPS
ncbi:MAG: hypothetical protein ACR2MO_03950 [Acidimicrobiales bacterium]